MSFTIKTRGVADRPIVAEYLCPVHGRFELTVDRDASGDAPAEAACPSRVEVRMFDLFGATPEEANRQLTCRHASPYVISAPMVRVRRVEVARGSYQKAERPTWTDTTNLGEGQDLEDWQADRDKVWEADRENEVMQLTKELG